MIKPPDWYMIAKAQVEVEQRQPRQRRPVAEVKVRRTTISEQDRQDRQFCAILGSMLLAYCIPVWAMAIAIAQQISA